MEIAMDVKFYAKLSVNSDFVRFSTMNSLRII